MKKNKAAGGDGFNRVKPCRDGMFVFNGNDVFIGRSLEFYGEYSEGEAKVFRDLVRPGATALDIGANIGVFTVAMARAAGSKGMVIAFEPQRLTFQTLCANVALNSLANVDCRNAAVGRRKGTITVPLLDPEAAQNFGGVSLGSEGEGMKVDMVTVDGLKLKACDFIKIDVEGMEQEVLAGAGRTIAKFRPLLYVENDRQEKSAALIRAIDGLGYRMFWHAVPLFNPNNFAGNTQNVFGRVVSLNMLCVAAELNPRIGGMQPVVVA